MDNLLKAEFFKLSRDRSFWTIILGLIVIACSYIMLNYYILGIASISITELYKSVALDGINSYSVKFLPCILAGFFISQEYAIGTMKSMGAAGHGRHRIYVAKLIVFSLATVIIALTLPITLAIVGVMFYGFNDVPGLNYIVQTVGLTAVYGSAFAAIMTFFATIFTDSGKTIGFLFLFFATFESTLYILSQRFSLIEAIYNYSIFKLFLDISAFNISDGGMMKIILIPIITFILIGLLGSFVFQKKEIK